MQSGTVKYSVYLIDIQAIFCITLHNDIRRIKCLMQSFS
jgi:hypothetical protein